MHHILGTTLYWDSLLLLKMNLLEENATALCRKCSCLVVCLPKEKKIKNCHLDCKWITQYS
ncbi:hypothetical protein D0Y65_048355 [Glycine soja]|uniref:Uncharacterized protein n=1 Tax=Glycine soja TaxID=3848 RepID=A0A445FSL7_GLYSO|nr:hypothetical protein D0Y65_048355 [Glycine soja]